MQSQTSDQHVKTVQNPKQFYPLFWGPSLCIIDQDQERDFLGDTNSKGPALSLPSLVQSQTSDQHVKTVQCPKQFYPFFWGLSLCITDQDQERYFLGDTNSLKGQV